MGKNIKLKDKKLPTFPMSQKMEKRALQALKDYREGKVKKFKSVDALMSSI